MSNFEKVCDAAYSLMKNFRDFFRVMKHHVDEDDFDFIFVDVLEYYWKDEEYHKQELTEPAKEAFDAFLRLLCDLTTPVDDDIWDGFEEYDFSEEKFVVYISYEEVA